MTGRFGVARSSAPEGAGCLARSQASSLVAGCKCEYSLQIGPENQQVEQRKYTQHYKLSVFHTF
eukprot:6480199-Amphidinium_carterae.2